MRRVEQRRPDWRRRDNAELAATLIAIILMAAMFVWVHFQGQRLDTQQSKITAQQAQLGRQQAILGQQQERIRDLTARLQATSNKLGADRLFLIESCRRLQIVRVEDNVSHYADYLLYMAAALLPTPAYFHDRVERAIRLKSWVPVTNCEQAVNSEGVAYKPPRPVPFWKRLPSKADLTLPASDFR